MVKRTPNDVLLNAHSLHILVRYLSGRDGFTQGVLRVYERNSSNRDELLHSCRVVTPENEISYYTMLLSR